MPRSKSIDEEAGHDRIACCFRLLTPEQSGVALQMTLPFPCLRAMFVAYALLSIARAHADTFIVSNTANAGPGSLRQAILDANAHQVTGGTACAGHTIEFAIAGSGTHTIQPLSPLPRFDIPIDIDGYSQPGSSANTSFHGSNAVITIELDGSLAGASDALVIGEFIPGSATCSASTSVIHGLVINRFQGAAISMGEQPCPPNQVCSVGAVRIQGNYIGTDVSGTIALGNGIALGRPALLFGTSSTSNIVGDEIASNGGPTDPLAFTRNVISGNGADAILITSISSTPMTGRSENHRIRNNYIGLAANGAAALPNAGRGITVAANGAFIAIHQNLISANTGDGVAILGGPVPGSDLWRNGIGIGVGFEAFGNGGHGVLIAGNATTASINGRYESTLQKASIANNGGAGVFVQDLAFLDAGNLSAADNAGLAIDLAPAGVNPDDPGDADSGPNGLLNAPVIASAQRDDATSTTTIEGSLDAEPLTSYEIHFSLSGHCDAGGFGGGEVPYALTPPQLFVTTDAAGHAAFTREQQFLPLGHYLTAVTRQTVMSGEQFAFVVSEFSNCRVIASSSDRIFANAFD
jgi:hypothetical protein